MPKSAAQPQAPIEPADLIIARGHILAASGPAEALAIRHGVIVAVGNAAAVNVYRGAKSSVIDVQGDTVLPGLHDLHVHPVLSGISAGECGVPQGS